MPPLELAALSIGLAMDAFAVAIGVGMVLEKVSKRHTFRLAFHFGLFQFLMPILGWAGGRTIASYMENYDHWIALGLLSYIGGKMLKGEADEDAESGEKAKKADPTRGLSLIMLSVATSIDALAVGLSLSFLNIDILFPSTVIGFTAAVLTLCGLLLGRRCGLRFGRRMEILGGLILIGIGAKIAVEHVFLS